MKQRIKREIIYWVVNLFILIYLVSVNTTGFINSLKMWIIIAMSMIIGRGFEIWIKAKEDKKEGENNQ